MVDPKELLSFPDGCMAVDVIIEGDAVATPDTVRRVIEKHRLTSDSTTEELTDVVQAKEVGDSLGFVEAAEAGESDCKTCGGASNPDRANICSFGAFLSRVV